MQVADQLARRRRPPGSASSRSRRTPSRPRRRGRRGARSGGRRSAAAPTTTGARGEAEGTGEAFVLALLQHPLLAGLVDQRLDLLAGERRRHGAGGLQPQQSYDAVGGAVERDHRRLEDRHERHHRRAEHEGRSLGTGERDVLRHHLAEHDVQVDHDRQRDRERHRVEQALGHVDRVEHGLEQVRQRRLGDRAERQRRDRDPELGGRHHLGDVLHRAQRGARDPGAGRRPSARSWYDGPTRARTRAPTKNALVSSSRTPDQHRGLGAHALLTGFGRTDGLSTRRIDEPVDAQAVHAHDAQLGVLLHRVLVVVLGDHDRQRHVDLVAPLGDPAELPDQQAGHGVVVLVLGQRQPGRVGAPRRAGAARRRSSEPSGRCRSREP